MRKELIEKMIRMYGFENPIVVKFCGLCEKFPHEKIYDCLLKGMVRNYTNNK